MKRYLKTLIEEKGRDLDDEIIIDGHIGLTYRMLVDQILLIDLRYHKMAALAAVAIISAYIETVAQHVPDQDDPQYVSGD